jgi:hypothetical protein
MINNIESDYIIFNNSQVIFKITLFGHFYESGNYDYRARNFLYFFAKSRESLFDYIMNNKKDFINSVKQQRLMNKKLVIRKKDNFDLTENLKIENIKNMKHSISVHKDKIYFTDLGLISLKEWYDKRIEYII